MNVGYRDRSSARGFTLLEILVVMVIAALMLTLIPPLFSGAVSGTQLKGSARDLVTLLRETRSQAIVHNTELLVHLDLEASHYRIGNGKPQALPDHVEIAVETITGTRVPQRSKHTLYFFPDGSTSGELITLSGGSRAYYLHLNWLTGAITVSEGARDAV